MHSLEAKSKLLLTFSGPCFVMEPKSPDWSVLKMQMPNTYPVIEIAFRNNKWWQLPKETSDEILSKFLANEKDIGYTWDWGDQRYGSWRPNDEPTSINRYLLDFETKTQRNIDTQRERSFRISWVDLDLVKAVKTGRFTT